MLIPAFQFNDDYDAVAPVEAVIKHFTGAGMSGWAVWRWFHVENPWVERRPADLVEAGDWEVLTQAVQRLVDGQSGTENGER